LFFWILCGVLLTADQWSKHWIQKHYWVGQSLEIIPGFLNLTHVLNDGMAFGLFQGKNVLLGIIVAGIMAGMFWWSRNLNWRKTEVNVVAALIASGAVGNLIDRIRIGHVIDFVDVNLYVYHWPVFNIADSCISLSMVWILLSMWRSHQQDCANETKVI
jgi:signal peptidase II